MASLLVILLCAWGLPAKAGPSRAERARGGLLYFKSGGTGRTDLWVQSLDGRHHRRLTSTGRVVALEPLLQPAPMNGAEISPDGKSVAYVERGPRMGARGGDDGQTLTGAWDSLWLVSSDGKERRKLLEVPGTLPGPKGTVRTGSFVWSPDGRYLAFVREHFTPPPGREVCPRVSIHKVEVESGKVTPIVLEQELGYTELLGWASEREELLLFSRCGLRIGAPGEFQEFLRVLPVVGGKARSTSASGPAPSPDGAFVYLPPQPPPNPTPPGLFRITGTGLSPALQLAPSKPGFLHWFHRAPGGVFTALDCRYQAEGQCHDALRPRKMYRVDIATQQVVLVRAEADHIHVLAFSPDDTQALVGLAIQENPKPSPIGARGWQEKLYLVPSGLLLEDASWKELQRQGTALGGFQHWGTSEHVHAYVGWLR
ncbi:TolB family protein [Archangium violaceum]|uniref:TolB family protein n=1 Tax=Archangium violaceum TaxID=83451 RepID=UPI0037BFD4E3